MARRNRRNPARRAARRAAGNLIDEKRAGLTLGLLFAIVSAAWAVLAATGGASTLCTWLYGLYFISLPITALPFNVVTAIMGIIVAFISGTVLGWLIAAVWNAVKRR